jgi:hypothetical protein
MEIVHQKFIDLATCPLAKSPDFRASPSPPAVWGLTHSSNLSLNLATDALPPPQWQPGNHPGPDFPPGIPGPSPSPPPT